MIQRQPIELLKLNPRTYNALVKFNIKFIDEVQEMPPLWLTLIPGVGEHGAKEIIKLSKAYVPQELPVFKKVYAKRKKKRYLTKKQRSLRGSLDSQRKRGWTYYLEPDTESLQGSLGGADN